MTVELRTGDLFAQGFTTLGHGVNCRGLMGAGIAVEFRRRWPAMYHAYRHECEVGHILPGTVFPWRAPDGTTVLNLATQDRTGAHASLRAVELALARALSYAELRGIAEFGIPRLGCGIGGLAWADVSAVLHRTAGPSDVTVVVVSPPHQASQQRAS